MCVEYSLSATASGIAAQFQVAGIVSKNWTPSAAIKPTQIVPVLTSSPRGMLLADMIWTFVTPDRMNDRQPSGLAHARSETIDQLPSFAAAFRHSRCLVPADGFSLRSKRGQLKQFEIAGGAIFTLAAIWSEWHVGSVRAGTFAILTTDASAAVREVHHRMPVIVPPEDRAAWLAPSSRPAELQSIMVPYSADDLDLHSPAKRADPFELTLF